MPKFTIKYAPESLEEIQNNISYYNQLLPVLGNRFKKNFLDAIALLKTNPLYNSFRYDNVRFAVVKKLDTDIKEKIYFVFDNLFTTQNLKCNSCII